MLTKIRESDSCRNVGVKSCRRAGGINTLVYQRILLLLLKQAIDGRSVIHHRTVVFKHEINIKLQKSGKIVFSPEKRGIGF